MEQPFDRGLHLAQRCRAASQRRQAMHQTITLRRQVLGQVIQNLGAAMGRLALPASGRARRLHGIADVFAVALGHNPQQPFAMAHFAAVTAIRAHLFAADVQLGAAVHAVALADRRFDLNRCFRSRRQLARNARTDDRRNRPMHQVLAQALAPAFAAEARLTVAAKAARGIELIGGVDPHHTGLQSRRYFQGQTDRFAPDAGRQTVAGVVGQVDGFARRAKCLYHQHRPEDLVLDDLGAAVHARHQGWWKVATGAMGHAVAALKDFGALCSGALHEAGHSLTLAVVDQGADIH